MALDGDFGKLTLQAVQIYYNDANKTNVTQEEFNVLVQAENNFVGYASAPQRDYEIELGKIFNRAILRDAMTSQWEDNITNLNVENEGV